MANGVDFSIGPGTRNLGGVHSAGNPGLGFGNRKTRQRMGGGSPKKEGDRGGDGCGIGEGGEAQRLGFRTYQGRYHPEHSFSGPFDHRRRPISILVERVAASTGGPESRDL